MTTTDYKTHAVAALVTIGLVLSVFIMLVASQSNTSVTPLITECGVNTNC